MTWFRTSHYDSNLSILKLFTLSLLSLLNIGFMSAVGVDCSNVQVGEGVIYYAELQSDKSMKSVFVFACMPLGTVGHSLNILEKISNIYLLHFSFSVTTAYEVNIQTYLPLMFINDNNK